MIFYIPIPHDIWKCVRDSCRQYNRFKIIVKHENWFLVVQAFLFYLFIFVFFLAEGLLKSTGGTWRTRLCNGLGSAVTAAAMATVLISKQPSAAAARCVTARTAARKITPTMSYFCQTTICFCTKRTPSEFLSCTNVEEIVFSKLKLKKKKTSKKRLYLTRNARLFKMCLFFYFFQFFNFFYRYI